MSFLKGFRTYISCALIAIGGAAVALQQSCIADASELGDVICGVVSQGWYGQAIVIMAAVAAWFRKLADK